MQARTIGAFGLGVAAGVLGLALALWASGSLKRPSTGAATPAAAPVAPRAAEPQSQHQQAPYPVPARAEPRGEADRAEPEPASVDHAPRLAMPLAGFDPAKIPDTFSDPRQSGQHEALDIPAPRGTPVHAVAEGNVVKLFSSKRGGLTVYQFDDSRLWCFYYAHLDSYAPGLKEGTLLRRGDVLGYVGSTGDASPNAPHLHLAVFQLGPEKKWWKGTAVDPLPLLR